MKRITIISFAKKRKMIFDNPTFYHCYQRPLDRGVIFYDRFDHLLYFTIICVRSLQYNVKLLKLVQMPDHIHHSVIEQQQGELSAFLDDVTSTFTREYNNAHGRKGPLFERPFGRSAKKKDKLIRTNLIYLDNNPVERQLVKSAQEYRWNYLAYGASDYPFSEKIRLNRASAALRRAVAIVKSIYEEETYLTYALLRTVFSFIQKDIEKEQLTDFIVSTYSELDHMTAWAHFGSYQNELAAAQASSGSEYDLKESFNGVNDSYYSDMTELVLDSGLVKDVHEVYTMPIEKKQALFTLLKRKTAAHWRQISSFLHYPLED